MDTYITFDSWRLSSYGQRKEEQDKALKPTQDNNLIPLQRLKLSSSRLQVALCQCTRPRPPSLPVGFRCKSATSSEAFNSSVVHHLLHHALPWWTTGRSSWLWKTRSLCVKRLQRRRILSLQTSNVLSKNVSVGHTFLRTLRRLQLWTHCLLHTHCLLPHRLRLGSCALAVQGTGGSEGCCTTCV